MTGFRLSLALSVAAHAVLLALLLLLPAPPRFSLPPIGSRIEVAVVPSLPQPPAPPPPPQPPKPPPPPPPPVEQPPPPAPPPKIEPQPPAPEATVAEPPPPPPPRKPRVPEPRRRIERRPEREPPAPAYVPPEPAARSPPPQPAPPQTAYVPAPRRMPAPAAEISPGYRAALGEWLNRHKRYPETARQRREQGRAVLRFTLDRSGRVDSFAITQSTGYPDLDAALERMMQGAAMPPFPADMPQPRIEVSVAIRFSLEQ